MRTSFTGMGTALVTPFRKDGSVDEVAVRQLVRRQVDSGIHFVSPCGTTGEAPTLTHREKLRVVELVVDEVAGRAPAVTTRAR
jgi:4-hydroxy-tetrahydrodipicolinate synthase